jgi:hypothetical protein
MHLLYLDFILITLYYSSSANVQPMSVLDLDSVSDMSIPLCSSHLNGKIQRVLVPSTFKHRVAAVGNLNLEEL